METRGRSLVKAVVWNMIGLTVMTAVGFAATGSASVGGAMALINTVIGFVTYVMYERIWEQIAWGRTGVPQHA
ncbi:MAG: hypothetical protein BM562_10445 [Alphaproteobacteria bacterium MedPE-SWcel]|nr:MAG: hypothetical protein BM562_10445 [Alphaproteobacteria bacterium MedPE-SWcel]